MSDLTHFDLQPLQIDPEAKAITIGPTTRKAPRTLVAEIQSLNALHTTLISGQEGVSPAGIPLPPVPVNPKRSAHITKIRDTGNAEAKKGHYAEALKLYTAAIELASTRPLWEPSQLAREELASLYATRAGGYMALQMWAEGAVDAETSVELKRVGDATPWVRRGRCLVEMGRLEEAREYVKKGIELVSEEGELGALLKEIDGKLVKGRK